MMRSHFGTRQRAHTYYGISKLVCVTYIMNIYIIILAFIYIYITYNIYITILKKKQYIERLKGVS